MMGPDNRQLIEAAIAQDVTENGNSFYTRLWQVQNIPAKNRPEVATKVIKHNRKTAKAFVIAGYFCYDLDASNRHGYWRKFLFSNRSIDTSYFESSIKQII